MTEQDTNTGTQTNVDNGPASQSRLEGGELSGDANGDISGDPGARPSRTSRPVRPQRGLFWLTLTLLIGWLCYLAYLSFA